MLEPYARTVDLTPPPSGMRTSLPGRVALLRLSLLRFSDPTPVTGHVPTSGRYLSTAATSAMLAVSYEAERPTQRLSFSRKLGAGMGLRPLLR